jgi:hypothetical protein
VHVAGSHHAPGGCNADLRFLKIIGGKTDRVQHGPAGGSLGAVYNDGRVLSFQRIGLIRSAAGLFLSNCFHINKLSVSPKTDSMARRQGFSKIFIFGRTWNTFSALFTNYE